LIYQPFGGLQIIAFLVNKGTKFDLYLGSGEFIKRLQDFKTGNSPI
jgi:hypothetical protein